MFLFMNFYHVLPVALMVIVSSRGCLLHFIENLCYVCVFICFCSLFFTAVQQSNLQWTCLRGTFIKTDWLCVAIVCQSGPTWRNKTVQIVGLHFYLFTRMKVSCFGVSVKGLTTWLWTQYTVFVKMFILKTWHMYIKLYFSHKQLVST